MLEFEVLEKGRSQISAFWSLAITASPSGFKKLSTVLLFAFLTNENFILYHSVDVIWDKLIRGCATNLHKGPFKYYVCKKVGGWGMPNAYVFLHGGWVGLARCLRNQKTRKKRKTQKNC